MEKKHFYPIFSILFMFPMQILKSYLSMQGHAIGILHYSFPQRLTNKHQSKYKNSIILENHNKGANCAHYEIITNYTPYLSAPLPEAPATPPAVMTHIQPKCEGFMFQQQSQRRPHSWLQTYCTRGICGLAIVSASG